MKEHRRAQRQPEWTSTAAFLGLMDQLEAFVGTAVFCSQAAAAQGLPSVSSSAWPYRQRQPEVLGGFTVDLLWVYSHCEGEPWWATGLCHASVRLALSGRCARVD